MVTAGVLACALGTELTGAVGAGDNGTANGDALELGDGRDNGPPADGTGAPNGDAPNGNGDGEPNAAPETGAGGANGDEGAAPNGFGVADRGAAKGEPPSGLDVIQAGADRVGDAPAAVGGVAAKGEFPKTGDENGEPAEGDGAEGNPLLAGGLSVNGDPLGAGALGATGNPLLNGGLGGTGNPAPAPGSGAAGSPLLAGGVDAEEGPVLTGAVGADGKPPPEAGLGATAKGLPKGAVVAAGEVLPAGGVGATGNPSLACGATLAAPPDVGGIAGGAPARTTPLASTSNSCPQPSQAVRVSPPSPVAPAKNNILRQFVHAMSIAWPHPPSAAAILPGFGPASEAK